MGRSGKLSNVFDHTINYLAYIAGGIIIFVALSIFLNVMSRQLLRVSVLGVIEIGEYSLCYITFLATAWLLKKEGHVRMDIVVNRLNPAKQAWVNMFMSVIGAGLCLTLAWYGVIVTLDAWQRNVFLSSTVLQAPLALLLFIIPVGCFLLFIQFLRRAYGSIASWRREMKSEADISEL